MASSLRRITRERFYEMMDETVQAAPIEEQAKLRRIAAQTRKWVATLSDADFRRLMRITEQMGEGGQ